jgi:hypothetical protein
MAALFAIGCKKTATIEGELSLASESGEARKGIGHTVFLLRNADSISLAVDRTCKDIKAQETQRVERAREMDAKAELFKRASEKASMRAQVALYDSVDKYRQAANAERRTEIVQSSSADRIKEMLLSVVDTQVVTDMDGHYRFENVVPGRYVLYVEWLSDQLYPFWAPVEVGKGDDETLNLDRGTLATAKLRCQ